jgi:hypothetical protein
MLRAWIVILKKNQNNAAVVTTAATAVIENNHRQRSSSFKAAFLTNAAFLFFALFFCFFACFSQINVVVALTATPVSVDNGGLIPEKSRHYWQLRRYRT